MCGAAEEAGLKPRVTIGLSPRVRGNRLICNRRLAKLSGLSPRVRGNRVGNAVNRQSIGSIPTCAGQPSGWLACVGCQGVYPHVCGAAKLPDMATSPVRGLSPRVRGSHRRWFGLPTDDRSIPTCAGQPLCRSQRTSIRWVYPRVCGAASDLF